MATTCGKDGKQEEVDASKKAFAEQEEHLRLDYQRDKIINDCVVNGNLSYEKAKESLIANYIEGKSLDEWPMDKIKEAVSRLEQGMIQNLRSEIKDEKTLRELERSKPERDVQRISRSEVERRQAKYPGQIDEYGRRDYIPADAKDVVENSSFKAGTVVLKNQGKSPRPPEHDRIIQLKNDPSVQAVHIHEHAEGLTLSFFGLDGTRDNFDIRRNVQQKYNVTIVVDD